MKAICTVQLCDNFKSYASMHLDFVSLSWSKTIKYIKQMIKEGEAEIYPEYATKEEQKRAWEQLNQTINQYRSKKDIVSDLNSLIDGLFIQLWED